VGSFPDAVLVDTANDTLFVASQFGNSVTAIDLGTNQVVATIPVGSRPYPQAITFDLANATLYVANAESNNVSAISVPESSVTASIPVGFTPDALAFNPTNREVYVADAGSAEVTLISSATNTVVATVPVESGPDALVLDTVNHQVFVADGVAGNVSILSGTTNTVVATVSVGTAPGAYGAMVFDPTDGDVFVANTGSNNVSVIGGTNHTLVATIPVGSGPSALAVDLAKGEVFVANQYSNNISVISAATDAVVATIPTGSDPGTDGAIAYNPTLGALYVPNSGSNNVSVISPATNTVVATVPVLATPDAVAVDTLTANVYVADQGAANVSIFHLSAVTFSEAGLPNGASWSVTAGSSPVPVTNTTVRGKGVIELPELSGLLRFTISPPTGYGISSVTGRGTPTQSSANVTNLPLPLAVKFGPIETLTFAEAGLPSGSLWGVAIATPLSYGGPPAQTATTHGTSIGFTVVKDTWKFQITPKPGLWKAQPAHGSVSLPAHSVTKSIKFTLPTAAVVFHEYGLANGTHWQVNVTGPMNVSLSSNAATIKFLLVNGTYTYVAWNFSTLHPHPRTGTFTVVAPHAAPVETITYLTEPVSADPGAGAVLACPSTSENFAFGVSIAVPGRVLG